MSDYSPITEDDQKNRPRHLGGVLTGLAHPYHWGSGAMRQAPSIPYGSSEIGGAHSGPVMSNLVKRGVIPDQGLDLPGFQSAHDPQRGGGTAPGIVLHAWSGTDLDKLYSLGCFTVAKQEWPSFRQDLLDYQKQNKGSAYLNVLPTGEARITSSPIYGADGTLSKDVPAHNAAVANSPPTAFTPQTSQVADASVPPILQGGFGRQPATQPATPADAGPVVAANSAPTNLPDDAPQPAKQAFSLPKTFADAASAAGAALTPAKDDGRAAASLKNFVDHDTAMNQSALASDPSRQAALAFLASRGAFTS